MKWKMRLKIDIYNKDFNFLWIPSGMVFNEEIYSLTLNFDNIKAAKRYIEIMFTILFNEMYNGNEEIKTILNNNLKEFIKSIPEEEPEEYKHYVKYLLDENNKSMISLEPNAQLTIPNLLFLTYKESQIYNKAKPFINWKEIKDLIINYCKDKIKE